MKNLMRFLFCLITVLRTTGAEEVIFARVGDSVTLNIPAPIENNYYIYWYFGTDNNKFAWITHLGGKNPNLDEMWKNKLSLTVNSLTITNIQEEHFGDFFSEVLTSPAKPKTRFRLVKVSADMNPASPVMPSDSVVLNCAVATPKGLNKPNIHWINPQGKNEARGQEKLHLKASSQVSGEWTCEVNKKKFPISVSVADFSPVSTLQYTSKTSPLRVPFLITPNDKVQEVIHKIKKVECLFTPKTSSIQQKLLSFSLGSEEMKTVDQNRDLRYTNFTKGGDFSLSRNLGREDDKGNYTCNVIFLNGYTLSSSVRVEVLEIVPSPGPKLISGNSLNLSCTTGDQLLPGLQVKWYHLKQLSLKQTDRLFIPKVSTEDSGNWRCELLRNGTRLTSAQITLSIDPILSVWMLVTICSAGLILILLLVVAFILYRRRQRKMRHLRHRLCQCAHPKPKGFYKT